jgi:glycosyltransferase involved in cell wall biosynthesis
MQKINMNVTLVIPSRNNGKYVSYAYRSIKKYLPKEVEVILLDDASTDGTWEWMQNMEKLEGPKIYRNEGPERIGHTVLYDIGAKMATNEIFGIFHADMIATPNYLTNMVKHLKRGTVVSATRIEPPLHPPGPEKIVENFGMEPEEFRTDEFLKFVGNQESLNKDKTTPGIFAPWLMYVEDFMSIGGHDKRVFAPMELEDSDLFNRFLLTGYKFVQARDSFVYHMTCRGSRFKDGIQIQQEIPVGGGKVWKRSKDSEEYTNLRQIKFREWWRKWHMNVLHDEMMMPKVCKRYDIGYIVRNATPQVLNFLEPWSDTIYVDLPHRPIALYLSEEQKISHYNIENRVKLINDKKTNNVLVEFDAVNFKQEHVKLIEDMMFILEDSGEVGEFEYDIFKFTIKSMESYEKNLINANDPWHLDKLK